MLDSRDMPYLWVLTMYVKRMVLSQDFNGPELP